MSQRTAQSCRPFWARFTWPTNVGATRRTTQSWKNSESLKGNKKVTLCKYATPQEVLKRDFPLFNNRGNPVYGQGHSATINEFAKMALREAQRKILAVPVCPVSGDLVTLQTEYGSFPKDPQLGTIRVMLACPRCINEAVKIRRKRVEAQRHTPPTWTQPEASKARNRVRYQEIAKEQPAKICYRPGNIILTADHEASTPTHFAFTKAGLTWLWPEYHFWTLVGRDVIEIL